MDQVYDGLWGASAYEQKFYFNQDFDSLPESVKQELHIMCVLYTEEIGGILTLEFDENGSLQFKTEALDADARYDEIGSVLRIKKLQTEKRSVYPCADGRCDGSSVSYALQRAGSRTSLYGDGQCEGNFFP